MVEGHRKLTENVIFIFRQKNNYLERTGINLSFNIWERWGTLKDASSPFRLRWSLMLFTGSWL